MKKYYTPPPISIFKEVKRAAIEVWKTMDHPEYIKEKVKHLENMQNIGDNFMTMIAMFSADNIIKLVPKLGPHARAEIRVRLLEVGAIEAVLFKIDS